MKCPDLRSAWWKASQVLSWKAPKSRSKMGRSQLLVFCEENVRVDSTQMTATATTTGNQTLNHQRQPRSERADEGCGL